MRTAAIPILSLLSLLLGAWFLLPVDVMVIQMEEGQKRLVILVKTSPGDEMVLTYVHSVERTPVEGRFRVSKRHRLLLSETRMASVGTGLPTESSRRVLRKGDWMVVDEGERDISELRIFLLPLNHPRLWVKGREIPVDTLMEKGGLLKIRLARTLRWRWYCWRVFGRGIGLEGTRDNPKEPDYLPALPGRSSAPFNQWPVMQTGSTP
jgi:hypothetical protein